MGYVLCEIDTHLYQQYNSENCMTNTYSYYSIQNGHDKTNYDSVKYLRILSIYPNESMKVLNKCRNGKVDITNEDIVNKLKNAKECDDIKLL